jgi:dTDP-4-amino-4,6-dideoxygalactose transaminase
LYKNGISTRPATHAIHMLSYYKKKYNFKKNDFFNSRVANDCSVSLPIYYGMRVNDAKYVANKILEFFDQYK